MLKNIFVYTLSMSLVCASLPASAEENRLLHCARFLMAQGADHASSIQSGELTKAALQELTRFRQEALSEQSFDPSAETARGNYTSPRSIKEAIAGRISGILNEGRNANALTEQGALKQTLAASVIVGTEDIQAEMQNRLEMDKALRQEFRYNNNINTAMRFVFFPMLTVAVFSMAYFGISELFHGNLVAAGIGAFFAWANRFVPENWVALMKMYVRSEREEQRALKNLARIGEGMWYFDSFDQELPLEVIQAIWRDGEVSSDTYARYHRWQNRLRHTASRADRFLVNHPTYVGDRPGTGPLTAWGVDKGETGFVRVDQVLTFDKASGQPQLITAIRLTEKRPLYPVRQPAPVRVQETQGAYGTAAQPIF